jgi:NADH:ubiquinone oxidoreductase subunit
VGKDEYNNKYYKSKKNERWVIYSKNIEATKITSDWYLWIHHTIDKIPDQNDNKKYIWQKKHSENQTGSKNSYKPTKIKKNDNEKKYETWK